MRCEMNKMESERKREMKLDIGTDILKQKTPRDGYLKLYM